MSMHAYGDEYHPEVIEIPPLDALRSQVLRRAIETIIELRLGVSPEHIRGITRGRRHIVFARHLTFYLAQSVSGASLTAIAKVFGRDRQVVSYAMRRIEEQRDDSRMDRTIDLLTAEASRMFNSGCRRIETGLVQKLPGIAEVGHD